MNQFIKFCDEAINSLQPKNHLTNMKLNATLDKQILSEKAITIDQTTTALTLATRLHEPAENSESTIILKKLETEISGLCEFFNQIPFHGNILMNEWRLACEQLIRRVKILVDGCFRETNHTDFNCAFLWNSANFSNLSVCNRAAFLKKWEICESTIQDITEEITAGSSFLTRYIFCIQRLFDKVEDEIDNLDLDIVLFLGQKIESECDSLVSASEHESIGIFAPYIESVSSLVEELAFLMESDWSENFLRSFRKQIQALVDRLPNR